MRRQPWSEVLVQFSGTKTCLHFHGEAAAEVDCQLDKGGEEERQDPGHTGGFHLLHCCIATLLHCYIATLLHCYIATLLHCYIATLHLLHCYTLIDYTFYVRSLKLLPPSATPGKSFGGKWTETDEDQRKRTEAEQKISKCSVLSSVFIHIFRLLHLLHLSLITCLTARSCRIYAKMYEHRLIEGGQNYCSCQGLVWKIPDQLHEKLSLGLLGGIAIVRLDWELDEGVPATEMDNFWIS